MLWYFVLIAWRIAFWMLKNSGLPALLVSHMLVGLDGFKDVKIWFGYEGGYLGNHVGLFDLCWACHHSAGIHN